MPGRMSGSRPAWPKAEDPEPAVRGAEAPAVVVLVDPAAPFALAVPPGPAVLKPGVFALAPKPAGMEPPGPPDAIAAAGVPIEEVTGLLAICEAGTPMPLAPLPAFGF